MQFQEEMQNCWTWVDEQYDSKVILGEAASQAVLLWSTQASHHEFPFGMSVMASLFGCTNGAQLQLFPNASNPLMMPVINTNYPQTRKSSTFSSTTSVTKAIDEMCVERVSDKWEASKKKGPVVADPNGDPEEAGNANAPPKVKSATLTSFTDAAFFQRCAGDWQQVCNASSIGLDSGRIHYSTLVNLDEAYKLFKMLGLLENVLKTEVSDVASEFNRLLQTGKASLTTKTAGTFGEGPSPSISLGLVGNSHPVVTIPLEKGLVGSHVVAIVERLQYDDSRVRYGALRVLLKLEPAVAASLVAAIVAELA